MAYITYYVKGTNMAVPQSNMRWPVLTHQFLLWNLYSKLLPAISLGFVEIFCSLNHALKWFLKADKNQTQSNKIWNLTRYFNRLSKSSRPTVYWVVKNRSAVLMSWPPANIPNFNKIWLLRWSSRFEIVHLKITWDLLLLTKSYS